MQILQLVSNQSDALEAIKCKEENIDDTQKVWMDAIQEKQLAAILDETQGWKKLARHFNFQNLLNTFEQSSSSSTLLLLNYIAVRFLFSLSSISCIIPCSFINACIFKCEIINYVYNSYFFL